ncbi:DUF1345 domain-containing protein [Novosphingobium album (ex Liu et al. 2023)]|uniref:DUF1345 domain-containing protein n=1 Tax=Novosphingobium album (ex Liu et al. 2023) TaxID=3031130 RepID=A0ABT5WUV5_9SPHN|nr:DUF1345 domain-containing protein [Novosphingobium album (ex Liu et al. 2023)]MDE8653659.1 DUF1345 domain-containing protein [Novosphingobium album (ex Liu et al. 2023)]
MTRREQGWLSRLRHPRYVLFLVVLVFGMGGCVAVLPVAEAILIGFDLAALAFLASCVPLWYSGDADAMRRQAKRDDVGQVLLLVLSGLISTVVLVTLGTLFLAKERLGPWGIALLVVTLIASWTFANLICAFHYARLYYTADGEGDHGGLDYPGDCTPDFADFVNFAFVIGMTCQTADIGITSTRMRRVSTFQGLFAFAFNLGILALTVNVLASSTS